MNAVHNASSNAPKRLVAAVGASAAIALGATAHAAARTTGVSDGQLERAARMRGVSAQDASQIGHQLDAIGYDRRRALTFLRTPRPQLTIVPSSTTEPPTPVVRARSAAAPGASTAVAPSSVACGWANTKYNLRGSAGDYGYIFLRTDWCWDGKSVHETPHAVASAHTNTYGAVMGVSITSRGITSRGWLARPTAYRIGMTGHMRQCIPHTSFGCVDWADPWIINDLGHTGRVSKTQGGW